MQLSGINPECLLNNIPADKNEKRGKPYVDAYEILKCYSLLSLFVIYLYIHN